MICPLLQVQVIRYIFFLQIALFLTLTFFIITINSVYHICDDNYICASRAATNFSLPFYSLTIDTIEVS